MHPGRADIVYSGPAGVPGGSITLSDSRDLREHLAGVGFPDLDGTVAASGGHLLAVSGKGNGPDRAGVAPEDHDFLVEGWVPDPDRSIVACGSQPPAVGGKREVFDL